MWVQENYYSLDDIKEIQTKPPYFNGEREYFEITIFYKDTTLTDIKVVKNHSGDTREEYKRIMEELKKSVGSDK